MDQTENKLSIYDFGKQLLKSGDLDPVYIVLWEAMQAGDLEPMTLRRWLIAYWCFYHVGTASWAVSQPDYWQAMETVAGSKEYPRSSERRHFRGENARKSVKYLRNRGSAALFDDLAQAGSDARKVIWAVQQWVGFGPWIAFKVADMLERLDIQVVEFNTAVVMYDSPPGSGSVALGY